MAAGARRADPVRAEAAGDVLVITLDRPPANAVDVATSHALYAAFARLESDPGLRVGIVTGAGGRFFCAGWDLKAAAAGEAASASHGPGGFAGLTELHDRAKPVIAAVNGIAAGGGFELALAADLVVAADHAQFLLPETGLGIIPDSGGVLRLPRRLPRATRGRAAADRAVRDRRGGGRPRAGQPGRPRRSAASRRAGPGRAGGALGAAGRRRRPGGARRRRRTARSATASPRCARGGCPGTRRCWRRRTRPRGRPPSPSGARRGGRAAERPGARSRAAALPGVSPPDIPASSPGRITTRDQPGRVRLTGRRHPGY